jgi:Uma2 family endonuclease
MGLPQQNPRYTPEEYLRLEREATERHQYFQGEIFAMAGGSPEHSLIISNVNGGLWSRLKGSPCRVYDSNLRVRIPKTSLYTYPDVTVVCGPLQLDPLDTRGETVLNAALIVEVLSPTTEAYDRVGKFDNYQSIESLREYVLVSQNVARVEAYLRRPDGAWLYTRAAGTDAEIRLHSLEITLPLAEVYAGITFPPPSPQPAPEEPRSPG